MLRSEASPEVTFTTLLKRYALPCWPRKFYEYTDLAQAVESEGRSRGRSAGRGMTAAHSRNDIFMIRQMCLAFLAAVDPVAIQVDIV
jgi:hypothetical protein